MLGFYYKINYKGLPFFIETKDKGKEKSLLVGNIYLHGSIIVSEKIPYYDIIKFEKLDRILRNLLIEMFKKMKTQLQNGYYDRLIESFLNKRKKKISAEDVINKVVMPFVEERFGKAIAERINNEIIFTDFSVAGNQREKFIKMCKDIIKFKVGGVEIFSMMFAGQTDSLLKQWIEEFDAISGMREISDYISAEQVIENNVLPEMQEQMGKYMTFKIWDTVKSRKLQEYQGLPEKDKFIKLCMDIFSFTVGFYYDEEWKEKILYWCKKFYKKERKYKVPASEATWKIIHPTLCELLGRYVADKLIMDAIQKSSNSIDERQKFLNIVSTLLENDMLKSLCDLQWIEQKKVQWLQQYEGYILNSSINV